MTSSIDAGTQYTVSLNAAVHQYRHGSKETEYDTANISSTSKTTLLPPSDFTVDGISGGSYILSWSVNANNGEIRVQISEDGGSTFKTDKSLNWDIESHTTVQEYDSSKEQLIKLVAVTSDSRNETETIAKRLAGSAAVYDGDGVNTEDSGEVLTD